MKLLRLRVVDPELKAIRNIAELMKKEGWENDVYGCENDVFVLEMSRTLSIPYQRANLTQAQVENLFCDTGDNVLG